MSGYISCLFIGLGTTLNFPVVLIHFIFEKWCFVWSILRYLIYPGKSHRGGRLSTVVLLSLITLDHLIMQHNLHFYKTRYLNEEVNRTEPYPSIRLPWTHRIQSRISPSIGALEPIKTRLKLWWLEGYNRTKTVYDSIRLFNDMSTIAID
jgi:hypothetical protein